MVAGDADAFFPRTAEVHACLPRGNHATNITEENSAVSVGSTEPPGADFFVGRRADFLPTLVIATSIVVSCYGTVLLTTLFFGSLNLLAIGIVGEYVGKIMIEVKGRPRLIRSAMIRDGKTTNLYPAHKKTKP